MGSLYVGFSDSWYIFCTMFSVFAFHVMSKQINLSSVGIEIFIALFADVWCAMSICIFGIITSIAFLSIACLLLVWLATQNAFSCIHCTSPVYHKLGSKLF